ncbi:MAG: hypothetical protein Q7R79_03705 [bacterium]|nr:hypothetical protein [bacterium]
MNRQLPQTHIVSRKPKEYLKQGPVHCGVYTIKAVLESFGKGAHKDPKDYHVHFLCRLTGTTTHGILTNILKKHGVRSVVKSAKGSNLEKLVALKSLLASNLPVPLSIGNGYVYAKNKSHYSRVKALLVGHVVSIWGYNDKEKVFYVYDSAVPKRNYDQSIPIGNIKRSYHELLRDWRGPFYTRYIYPYSYIEISKEALSN